MTRTVLASTLLIALLTGSIDAAAQSYPTRPIRLIASFPPGGGVDINARLIAEPLGKALGQTVVVDNRPGAGGRLGVEIASRATPDGYTLLLGGIGMAISRALYAKLPYDTLNDFAPISLLAEQPNILVVNLSVPAKSLQDLIALAKSKPGTLVYGTPGVGTGTHLATELLLTSERLNLLHVPYKGAGPSLTALLAHEISMYLSTFASALPHVKAERLRALAVTSAKRARPLPDVPTVAESGIAGYEYATWYGLLAPAGVATPIIDRVNQAVVAALESPDIKRIYEAQGLEPIPSTPAQYATHLRAETQKWTMVVKGAMIALQQ